jgi:hypothetical protein
MNVREVRRLPVRLGRMRVGRNEMRVRGYPRV